MTSGRSGRETSWGMDSVPPHPLQINEAEKYISSSYCCFFGTEAWGGSLLLMRSQIPDPALKNFIR